MSKMSDRKLRARDAKRDLGAELLESVQQMKHGEGTVVHSPAPDRAALLRQAAVVISGDRDMEYGSPTESFTMIAALWAAYLGVEIRPTDVAAMLTLMKTARVRANPTHVDSWRDIAGYAACGCEVSTQCGGRRNARDDAG